MMQKNFSENSLSDPHPPSRPSRALFILVVVMGVLIILGVAGLIGIIAHRAFHHAARVKPQQTVFSPLQDSGVPAEAIARLNLPLYAGEYIQNITPRGDGSVLIVLSNKKAPETAGDDHAIMTRILLWQPEQARLIAELSFTPSATPQK